MASTILLPRDPRVLAPAFTPSCADVGAGAFIGAVMENDR
jgi:hypothetical protein